MTVTLTYGQIGDALRAAIVASLPEDDNDIYVWVADFSDPAKLADLCRTRGLSEAARFDDGHLAVVRRRDLP